MSSAFAMVGTRLDGAVQEYFRNGWDFVSDSGPQVSTTVDRAGALLQLLAQHPEGLGITQLTRELGTQRAPLYRILQALAKHELVHRDARKQYLLGVGTLGLARAYSQQLPVGLEPQLQALADETGMSATVNTVDGDSITVVAARTPARNGEFVVTQPGFRHPVPPDSMRAAVAALEPPRDDDPEIVVEARRLGYAVGRGHAIASRYGVTAVVAGSAAHSRPVLILNLASIQPFEHERVAAPLLRTAQAIGLGLR